VDNDDFAANEQLAHAEHEAARRRVDSGRFSDIDFTRAIHLPSTDRGQDTISRSCRYPIWLDAAVNDMCGKGKKFRTMSDFCRHWVYLGLLKEQELEHDPDLDQFVIKGRLEAEKAAQEGFDQAVDLAGELLAKADGDPAKQKYLADLRRLREIAERDGHINRLATIDFILVKHSSR
jgi:hypothetical protein